MPDDARPYPGGVDFGRRSRDYAEHRPGFPESFYDRLETFIPLAAIRAVDLGTGPGIIAVELARRGATVTGVDVAAGQIDAARQRTTGMGLDGRCRYIVGPAENTGLPAGAFDLVTAGQCWGWFDEPAAFAECRRLLKPGGWLVIPQYCYLPLHSDVARDTEALILRHNPAWSMAGFDGLYPHRVDAVINGGFDFVEQVIYDHHQPFSHTAWRGRIRTCNGVGSSGMSVSEVEAFDRELSELLATRYPQEPIIIRHRVAAVFARRPSELPA